MPDHRPDSLDVLLRQARDLYARIPAMVGILDLASGRQLLANPMAEAVTGFTAEALEAGGLGRYMSRIPPEEPVHELLAKAQARLAAEGSVAALPEGMVLEYAFRRQDGRMAQLRSRITWLRPEVLDSPLVLVVTDDITQTWHLQAEIRASEERYRGLFEGARVGILQCDPAGRFITVNGAFARMLQREPETLVGATFREITHPEDLDTDEGLVAEALAGRRDQFRLDKRYLRADGSILWVNLHVTLVRDGEGRPSSFIGVVQDLSTLREAEQRVKEREELLGRVVQDAPLVLWALDAQGVFTLSEGRGLAALGLRPGEVVGRSVRDVYADHPEVLARVSSALQGEPVEAELVFGEVHFENRMTPVRTTDGSPAGVVGVSFDTTEAARVRLALEASEAKLASMIRFIPDGLSLSDPVTGRLLEINPAFEQLLGWTRAEALGRTSRELEIWVDWKDRVAVLEAIEHTGICREKEVTFRHRDGHAILTAFSAVLAPMEGGMLLVGLSRDIRERKQLEAALRESQHRESLGLMAGGVAHDFNNLLQALQGNLDVLAFRCRGQADLEAILARMDRVVRKAAGIATQMHHYAGSTEGCLGPVDLGAALTEFRPLLEASIPKRVQLLWEVQEGLPSVAADAHQVLGVLLKLVLNAVAAIGAGAGVVRIGLGQDEPGPDGLWVQPAPEGSCVTLAVADNGVGLDDAIMVRIFDPFFTTRIQGTGLGLSAVLGTARSHGAGLQVRSRVGEGSEFRLWFPVAGGFQSGDRPFPQGKALVLGMPVEDLGPHRELLALAGLELVGVEEGQPEPPDVALLLVALGDGKAEARARSLEEIPVVGILSGNRPSVGAGGLKTLGNLTTRMEPVVFFDALCRILGHPRG